MKTYTSFDALAADFRRSLENITPRLALAMEKSAVLVEEAAKAEIGHYQRENMGRWAPWAELKDSTQAERARAGYPKNDPLLRSGALREDIHHEAVFNHFVVGSASRILLWQELGAEHIAPRAVLALALFRHTPAILALVGKTLEKTLLGER